MSFLIQVLNVPEAMGGESSNLVCVFRVCFSSTYYGKIEKKHNILTKFKVSMLQIYLVTFKYNTGQRFW